MRNSILAAIGLGMLFGAPGSSAFATSIDLGAASGYLVLGLTGSTDQLSSGGLMINGNVGVASGAPLAMSSGTVTGLIETSALSNLSQSGGTTFVNGSACSSGRQPAPGSPVVPGALASAQSGATAAVTAATSPTQSITSIPGR
jgi:formylmethanofuran dehydrogenase subunit C